MPIPTGTQISIHFTTCIHIRFHLCIPLILYCVCRYVVICRYKVPIKASDTWNSDRKTCITEILHCFSQYVCKIGIRGMVFCIAYI